MYVRTCIHIRSYQHYRQVINCYKCASFAVDYICCSQPWLSRNGEYQKFKMFSSCTFKIILLIRPKVFERELEGNGYVYEISKIFLHLFQPEFQIPCLHVCNSIPIQHPAGGSLCVRFPLFRACKYAVVHNLWIHMA